MNTNSPVQQIIKQVISSWVGQSKVVTDLFTLYEDNHYQNEVAPGRNRGVYLLGHLISASDGMIPLLGFGERLYPEFVQLFSSNPDRSFELPSVEELKEKWTNLNKLLSDNFDKMQAEDWLDRHTNVSPEDFAVQPERNKLSILLGRTNHISYHSGQLIFLKKKEVLPL
ncbi:DinB family protein [Dyadobacter frigoris]|uniref:DinB family protein n=1 Tax=Dyadobacter frigoris TaxID=2576211 RepID=UPI0025579314|nr:DinB family protein [Dyadobacter frigoris]